MTSRARKTSALIAIPAIGISAMAVTALTSQTAGAAASDTCDAALITVNLSDDANNAVKLADGRYLVNTTGNVYLKAGDATGDELAFKTAYDNAIETPTWTTRGKNSPVAGFHGAAIFDAYQAQLGTTNKPPYPADITSLTNPAAQDAARAEWRADADGRIADFSADVDRRHAALTLALADNPNMATVDPALKAHIDDEVAKLETIQLSIGRTLQMPQISWNAFVTHYNRIVDPANWSYGISMTPTVEHIDAIGGKSSPAAEASASTAAAAAIGATQQVVATTDSAGNFTYTIFGVKADAYLDAGTRGDLTCSQLTSTIAETKAPTDYLIDPNTYTVSSGPDGTGSQNVTNERVDQTPPPPPVHTSTGL